MNQRESQVQETSDFSFRNYLNSTVPSLSSSYKMYYSTSRNTEILKLFYNSEICPRFNFNYIRKLKSQLSLEAVENYYQVKSFTENGL